MRHRDKALRYLRLVPLTAAVACGPAIDILQFATRGDDASGHLSQLIRGLLLVLMIGSTQWRRVSWRSGVPWSLLFLAAYGLLRTAALGEENEALVFGVRTCYLSLVYVCAFSFARTSAISERWLRAVAWTVLLSVIASQVCGSLLHVSSVYESAFEFPGITGEPSLIAAAVTALLPILLCRFPVRLLDAAGTALALLSIAGTQRRSALAAGLISLAVYGVLIGVRGGRGLAKSIGVLVALLVGLYVGLTVTPLGHELELRFEDRGGSGRAEFQAIAIDHIIQRDVIDNMFGEGLGAVRVEMGRSYGSAIGSHNDWIDYCYGTGLLGLALFLWYHAGLIRMALKLNADGMVAVWMSVTGLIVLELTASGALDPTMAPAFAMYGVLMGSSMRLHKMGLPRLPPGAGFRRAAVNR